mgnify:CR=1 FL=1
MNYLSSSNDGSSSSPDRQSSSHDARLAFARTAAKLPLVWRDLAGPVARITSPLEIFAGNCSDIATRDFLQQCQLLAQRLPEKKYVLNLCENPYLFTLTLCAAILRRQTTLLPQNRSPETLRRLAAEYDSSYILHHSQNVPAPEIANVDFSSWLTISSSNDDKSTATVEIPEIEADFIAAVAFTSGSTGTPKPIIKPWRTLVVSTLMNGACMLPEPEKLTYQLATVPPQHMWGLETGVLIPLFWPVCVADNRPLFPQEVARSIDSLPEPRMLVSTPVHLRALTGSGLSLPNCQRVLCATAPLSRELAQTCENSFGGDLLEIYGCSEIGSTAFRRPTQISDWRLIPGLYFTSLDTNSPPHIAGDHLPTEQALQDRVEILGDYFRLLGRNEDMVNVAGKRGSLMEITQVLLAIPGVIDAAAFMPETTDDNPVARPAALVVCPEEHRAALPQFFFQRLDPVFLPRPLLFVDALPREASGKLHRQKLLALYQQRMTQPAKRSQ